MTFKDFVTKQRINIFLIGVITFVLSIIVSHIIGFDSLWGELFVDLSASAVTIIFTAFIIDYLNLKERSNKTLNAASLAEDEIRSTCLRIKWNMARLFGFEQQGLRRQDVANHEDAEKYLAKITAEVDKYLSETLPEKQDVKLNDQFFSRYLERLQASINELEQALAVYEYALSYGLMETILALRRELQITDRLLGFIDSSQPISDSSRSLISVTTKGIYDAVEDVLSLSVAT